VLDNAILIMLIPPRLLRLPIFPKSLQQVGKTAEAFKAHMERMLAEQTAALKEGKTGAGSLMTSFLRSMNQHENRNESANTAQGLSLDEIFGNIFVIKFAGHDTTATTLAFSMLLLAANSEVPK
jgi:cytochrome P450